MLVPVDVEIILYDVGNDAGSGHEDLLKRILKTNDVRSLGQKEPYKSCTYVARNAQHSVQAIIQDEVRKAGLACTVYAQIIFKK